MKEPSRYCYVGGFFAISSEYEFIHNGCVTLLTYSVSDAPVQLTGFH